MSYCAEKIPISLWALYRLYRVEIVATYNILEVEGNNITWFTNTGAEDIPDDANHIFVHFTTILKRAFRSHLNTVEVIFCHEDVEKIEEEDCPSLERVIMPGVRVVKNHAFTCCEALTHVECVKLAGNN